MFAWLMIQLAAYKLGLRDRGLIEEKKYWDGIGKVRMVEETVIHKHCRTRARVGIMKKSGYRVYWCYRCEWVIDNDNRGSGGGGGAEAPPWAPPPNDVITPEVKAIADQVIAKIKTPS